MMMRIRLKVQEWDLVKFVMCTLVSMDCVSFCKYVKRHVYPENQSTYDKLNQIKKKVTLISRWNQHNQGWKTEQVELKMYIEILRNN